MRRPLRRQRRPRNPLFLLAIGLLTPPPEKEQNERDDHYSGDAPTTMPPMAPPERDLDDEVVETEDGVEGAGMELVELAFKASEALVVGAVVVSVELDDGVDEGVDEVVLEETLEVVCVAAVKDLGSKGQAVAPGSAALSDE
jgi:hypothetical protein